MQGLEIDWPIVTLTGDYYIRKDQNNNYRWVIDPQAYFNRGVHNKKQIIENVYRVLLTRRRIGRY